ncbi:patatin-like protein 2 [Quercus suber]|uniref:Patatin-like protein 2 n=1 Tax=Quercus suber TaxID=58331 RepID=A0AAW0MI66_QUESU
MRPFTSHHQITETATGIDLDVCYDVLGFSVMGKDDFLYVVMEHLRMNGGILGKLDTVDVVEVNLNEITIPKKQAYNFLQFLQFLREFKKRQKNFVSSVTSLVDELVGPKYDGMYLRSLTNQILGDLTVKQTLTDVIIPTFDTKLLQPVIFSTNDV